MKSISFSTLDELLKKHDLNDRVMRDLDSAELITDIYNQFSMSFKFTQNGQDVLSFLPYPDITGLLLRVTTEKERITTQLYSPYENHKIKIILQDNVYQKPQICVMSQMETAQLANIRFHRNVTGLTSTESEIRRIALCPGTPNNVIF